jgi:hypothetical protein
MFRKYLCRRHDDQMMWVLELPVKLACHPNRMCSVAARLASVLSLVSVKPSATKVPECEYVGSAVGSRSSEVPA